jgi:hypothetical protein
MGSFLTSFSIWGTEHRLVEINVEGMGGDILRSGCGEAWMRSLGETGKWRGVIVALTRLVNT